MDDEGEISDVLTNLALPKTDATLTVRVIKSFEFRTEKSLVLHNVNLVQTTVGELKERARTAIGNQAGWKPYRNATLDTMKIYSKAHGAKTTNLIINLDNDDWMLKDDSGTLSDCGFALEHDEYPSTTLPYTDPNIAFLAENETEVSFFNRELYESFKQNPEIKWDVNK